MHLLGQRSSVIELCHRKVGSPHVGVVGGPVATITDRLGAIYTVTSTPQGDGTAVCYVRAGEVLVVRAVRHFVKGCMDVLVYREADRRVETRRPSIACPLSLALYRLIETELGRLLRPSRIRFKAGRAFWANRS